MGSKHLFLISHACFCFGAIDDGLDRQSGMGNYRNKYRACPDRQ